MSYSHTPMNFTSLARSLADSLAIPLSVVVIVLVIASVGFVCYQTRSLLPVALGIWRLVMRRAPAPDRTLQEAMNHQVSLLWFRFFFRIRVNTLGQAKALLRWCRTNDIEPRSLAPCVPEFFDIEACEFQEHKIPPPRWMLFRFGTVMGGLMLLLSTLALGLVPRAIVKFHESGQWVMLSKESAITLSGLPIVNAGNCSTAPENSTTALEAFELKALCDFFGSNQSDDYIKGTIREQRYAAAAVLLPFALATVQLLKWFWSAASAADIRAALRRRREKVAKRRRPAAAGPIASAGPN